MFLLIFLQFNSSKNIDSLVKGNEKTLQEFMVNNHLRQLERDIHALENKVRFIIDKKDTGRVEDLEAEITQVKTSIDKLQRLSDKDSSITLIDKLDEAIQQKLSFVNSVLDTFYAAGKQPADRLLSDEKNKKLSDSIRTIVREIDTSRQRVLTTLTKNIDQNGLQAKTWGNILIIIVLGCSIGVVWFIVNRLKRQQELIHQLDSSEKQVKESSRIKENFMANMSHEIRTPMNAILGFTHLLQQKQLDKDAREFTDAIQKSGEGLLNIINDILDSSKIEAGMMRIESAPFNIHQLMDSVRVMFNEKIKEKRLDFIIQIGDDVPELLTGDSMRLTQILVNLIGNAIKFTAEGFITVTIINKGIQDNTVHVAFTITDTGIGIEQNNLTNIFDRFHQAEDSTTRRYGGTGLGLSIVKELVLLQNGSITAESEPGKGTTFFIDIPYKLSVLNDVAFQTIPRISPAIHLPGAYNILVAEDNSINQTLMRHLLKGWGFSFDIVANGNEALNQLSEKKYDLVLMDIQMPEMDGYTATRHIRSELKMDIPIIAMTAHALRGEKEKCLASGMNDYISKPIDATLLLEILSKFSSSVTEAHVPAKNTNNGTEFTFINMQYMHEISNGDVEYEKLVTEQFIEMIPEHLQALEYNFIANNITTLQQTAHNMKTTVSIMGLNDRLEPLLHSIESGDNIDHQSIQHTILEIKTICEKALAEARLFYNTL